MKGKRRLKTWLIRMMVCVLLCMTIVQPITAFAYSQVTTQVTIDDANWTIVAGVVEESVGGIAEENVLKEVKRIGADNLKTLAENNGSTRVGASLLEDLNVADLEQEGFEGDSADDNLVLSFPGKPRKGLLWKSSSNEYDKSRANTVKDILLYDLNAAYDFVYNGEKPDGIETYKSNMIALLNAVDSKGTVNGCSVSAATSSDVPSVADKTMDVSDYVVISNGNQEEIFAYRIPKGYVGSGRTYDESLGLNLSSSEDATYITWGEYAYEAFATYVLGEKYGLTTSTVYTGEPGALESMLVYVIESLVNALSSILGLWSMDELILNSGVRGGPGYVGGIFPGSWETMIWTVFFVMEILALIILSFAILAGIYKKAMSTVNPLVRASFMEQVKNICVSILVIILLPIIFRLMISTSATLTEIFTSMLGENTAKEQFASLSRSSGSLGGCIMQLVYLCSLIYFNFFYYLRSLLVAIVIAISPLLVMANAIGDSWRNITTEMFKAVLTAIFIQPIHALCLTMILLLPVDGRGFQSIVAIYALIPLTNMIRDIVFKGAGGTMNMAARAGEGNTMRYMNQARRIATVGALSAAGATVGAISDRFGSSGKGGQGSADGETTDVPGGGSGENLQNVKGEGRAEQAANRQPETPSIQNKGDADFQSPQTFKEKAATVAMVAAGTMAAAGTAARNSFTGAVNKTKQSAQYAKDHPIETLKSTGKDAIAASKTIGRGARRLATGAAGITIAGAGGMLQGAGCRNNLQQVGRGLIGSSLAANSRKAYESTPTMEQQQANLEPENHEKRESSYDPIQIGRNFADGASSEEEISALSMTDYTSMDGIYMNEDASELQAGKETLNKHGIHLSDPQNIAEKGQKPVWNENSDRTLSYAAVEMSDWEAANLSAGAKVFSGEDEAKKEALRKTGINNVSVQYQNVEGKRKPVSYHVEISDAKKFNENYGININDKTVGASGKKERVVSTTSGSFVPNLAKKMASQQTSPVEKETPSPETA